jgi:glutathione S-transferase
MFQRGVVFGMQGDNPAAIEHFQGIIKRTLRTMDDHLMGKTWVVGEKCTIADLAFVNWDDANVLDIAMKGDPEAATMEMREKMFPNWAAWHKKLLERPSVKKMKEAQRVAVSEMK